MRNRSSVARRSAEPTATTDGFFQEPDTGELREPPSVPPSESPGDGALRLEGGFERIVSRIYSVDIEAEYDDLERNLKLSQRASRADYGTIVDALDLAEDNARRAMALYVNAKVAAKSFELDVLAITGAMRKEVVQELNAAKIDEDGKPIKGIKQITEADVIGHMAAKFSSQYRDIETRKIKACEMVNYLERLAELWKQRARDLQVMAAGARQ